MVLLEIEGIEHKLKCEFNKITKDSKKTTLDFIVKGDSSAENTFNFYKKAGADVTLHIVETQMSTDDFEDEHEGIPYSVDKDGTAKISPDQLSLDDVDKVEDELDGDPFASPNDEDSLD